MSAVTPGFRTPADTFRHGAATGHYYSNDSGKTWKGQDSVPTKSLNAINPSTAFFTDSGFAYAASIGAFAFFQNWGQDTDFSNLAADELINGGGMDFPQIAVDNNHASPYYGRVYMTFAANNPSTILCIYSDDHGRTWTQYNSSTHVWSPVQVARDSPNGYYTPKITVSSTGEVFIAFRQAIADGFDPIGDGAQDNVYIYTSPNGGNTWYSQCTVATQLERHEEFSLAASPVGGLVALCYEAFAHDEFGPADNLDTIGLQITTDTTDILSSTKHFTYEYFLATSHHYALFPEMACDSFGRMFVSYYGSALGNHYYNNLYMAISRDTGQTWTDALVSDTAFNVHWDPPNNIDYDSASTDQMQDYGVGPVFGVTPMDSLHVGVAWCDNRARGTDSTFRVHFSYFSVTGVQFRNNFNNLYGYNLIYHKQSSSTVIDTVKSGTIVTTLQLDTSYTVHPDEYRRDSVFGTTENFEHFSWNGSSFPSSFLHTFNNSFQIVGSEEADYSHLDTLIAKNDLEGADTETLQFWEGSNTPTTVNSTFMIDSAFESVLEYNLQAQASFTILGTTWNLEGWVNSSGALTPGTTLSSFHVFGDTTFTARYKGHNRTNQSGIFFNNQRKTCWDSAKARYWRVYESNHNIYLSYSADTGCTWSSEIRINTSTNEYGTSMYPSICCSPPQTAYDSAMIYVVWEDTLAVGGGVQRQIHCYAFHDSTTPSYVMRDTVGLPAYAPGNWFGDPNPATPMACAVLPYGYRTTPAFFYGRAAVTWSDSTSICAGVLPPYGTFITTCDTTPSPSNPMVRVPSSAHGLCPAIEPGLGDSLAAPLNDATDFELTWHDPAGVKYDYLVLNCHTASGDSLFSYKVQDVVQKNVSSYSVSTGISSAVYNNSHASLAVAPGAEPIVSFQNNSFTYSPVSSSTYYVTSVVTRMKLKHDTTWGGERMVSRYYLHNDYIYTDYANPPVALDEASVTTYEGLLKYNLFYHVNNNSNDTIQSVNSGFTSFSGDTGYAQPNRKYLGRSPFQPYSQFTPPQDSNLIWTKDTSSTHALETATHLCSPSSISPPPFGGGVYQDAIVKWNDSAQVKFAVGEMQYISHGVGSGISAKELSMTTAIHSISDAAGQLHSLYFHVVDDTAKIAGFYLPLLTDTLQTIRNLGSGMIKFKVELCDSATGTVLDTIAEAVVSAGSPYVTGSKGTDTTTVIGDSGKTCYIQVTVDTLRAPSTFAFIPAQETSLDQLSSVFSPGGLGKAIARNTNEPPEISDMFKLSVTPNPFYPKATIAFHLSGSSSNAQTIVRIYDINGAEVTTLVSAMLASGNYSAVFDGTNLPSGSYRVQIQNGGQAESKMMVLVR